MPGGSVPLDPHALARLESLELRAKYIVDGYLTGQHRSPYRGQSVEFAEHREYVPGDDLRYVDWKVFGKTDRVYLKQFEAETNLICRLLLDVSQSMAYQSPAAPISKYEYASCLAAAIAHLIIRQRDSVGLTTFDNAIRETVDPGSNPNQLRQLLYVMENSEPQSPSNFGVALNEAAGRWRRRGVVVVISDFLGDADALLASLGGLRHRRHEVIALHVLDPAELDFPFEHATQFEGLEALPDLAVEPRGVRKAYLAALDEYLERLRGGLRAIQVDYKLARTDEPFDAPLRRLLTARSARRG